MNDHKVNPPVVNLGEMEYPQRHSRNHRFKFKDFYLVKGTEIALQIGDARAANVVLLGAMSRFFDIKEELWLNTILKYLPPKGPRAEQKSVRHGPGRNSSSVRAEKEPG